MSEVRLDNVVKHYGDYVAVAGVSFTLREGEFLTLLGPSGCGKTTTLRIIAGFVHPDEGTVRIGDADVSGVPSYRRNTGMVFQSYALFPHLTVADNVGFGLRVRKLPAEDIRRRVGEALELVHLSHLADQHPRQMSGGQQQRVALARAVVIRPAILLLDEPLGALDLKLRQELQIEIKRVQEALGITTLYVTHDQGEALSMSNRVAVMHGGQIVQMDSPIELYEQPNTAFVATFIGRTNLVDAEIVAYDAVGEIYTVRSATMRDLTFQVKMRSGGLKFDPGAPCLLGFRPERASFDGDKPNRLPARIERSTYFGSTWTVSLSSAIGQAISVEHIGVHLEQIAGDQVDVRWGITDCFLLPKEAI